MAIKGLQLMGKLSKDRLASGEPDLRRRTVVDMDGNKVGVVEEMLIDPALGRIRFIILRYPRFYLFRGMKPKRTAIPIELVDLQDSQVRVRLKQSVITHGPKYSYDIEDLQPFYDYWMIAPKVYGPANVPARWVVP